MSAICGVVRFDDRPVTAEDLRPSMDAIARYGRNGGPWIRAGVGLGLCRGNLFLNEGDEDGPQCQGGLTVAADARIDNRDALIRDLSVPPDEREDLTSEALVRLAYAEWGEDCPKHLVGDYAFAVWDEGRRRLFCARDPIGARPFYYARLPQAFVFATDIRGVLAAPGVPADIDEVEVAQMLLCESPGYCDSEHTYFRSVQKLPFGCCLTIAQGTWNLRRHWRPEGAPAVLLPKEADYAVRLRELVTQAVADRLRANGPVGAHLSGGLDSSTVAILTARLLRERGAPPPAVFAWSPPPGPPPYTGEYVRIEAVCRQEGLQPVYNDQTEDDFLAIMEDDVAALPMFAGGVERFLQKRAEELGVRLMLSGWGGDEGASFHGQGLMAERLRERRWREALACLGPLGGWWRLRRFLAMGRLLWREGAYPLLGPALREMLKPHRRRRSLIRSDFLKRIGPNLRRRGDPISAGVSGRQHQWQLYYRGHLTARIESWAASGADHQVCYGYPLLDRRVLEFVYAIPVDLHCRDGRGRQLYRKAMDHLLPPSMRRDGLKDETFVEQRSRVWNDALLDRWHEVLSTGHQNRQNPWVDEARLREKLVVGSKTRRDTYAAISLLHGMRGANLWRHWRNDSTEPGAPSSVLSTFKPYE